MDDAIKYHYPVEELDRMISEISKGATPMLTNDMKMEIALRKKELMAMTEGLTDEEETEFDSIVEEHDALMKKIDEEKRKATKREAAFRPLPPEVQRQLEIDMQTSFVWDDANSSYNKSDSELYEDAVQKDLYQRLSRVRNVYYDAISYRQAILTIREAITFSLKNDYPWMTYEEALQEFNAGKIRYLGNIPKLFMGFGTHQVTDPKILAGIVEGRIQVVDKNDDDQELRRRKKTKHKGPGVKAPYTVIGDQEYDYYKKLHNDGYDTPVSIVLKARSTVFDRLSMPFVSDTAPRERRQPVTFDWLREGAGEEYYRLKHGIPRQSVQSLMQSINEENDGELNQAMMTNMSDFLHELSRPIGQPETYRQMQFAQQQNDRAAEIEKNILDSIRRSNM